MESANLHYKHQQQQEHLDDQSSPFYDVEAARAAWTPTSILNNVDFNPNTIVTNSMTTEDMGFGSFTGLSAHDQLQLARIKDELSSSSSSSSDHHSNYPKFTEMLTNSSSSRIEDSHLLHTSSGSYFKNEQRNFLRTFSSGCQINSFTLPTYTGGGGGGGEFYSNPQQKYCPTASSTTTGVARGTFSQIFPTINISDMNQTASSNSSALSSSSSVDMNLEALDLLNGAGFSTGLSHGSHNHLGLFKSCSLPYNLDDMQMHLNPRPSNSPTTVSSGFNNGVTEVKRSNSFLETKSPQAAPKKSRLDSRSTCPPFKVRKEKLGDRIAALQQLVAPFGKTDTASVLMEAIGYIKFLTNQVETLSVPYMKLSRNRTRKIQGGLEDNEKEGTRDLRPRGLCLVPVSCLSYVTDGGGGGVWPPPPPPPNFGGGS